MSSGEDSYATFPCDPLPLGPSSPCGRTRGPGPSRGHVRRCLCEDQLLTRRAEGGRAQHEANPSPRASAVVLLHTGTPSSRPHGGPAGTPSLLPRLRWLLGFLCACWGTQLCFQFRNFPSVGSSSPSSHSNVVKSCPDQ